MNTRHSSPSPRAASPRPRAQRQRSNSLPMVEALGCSTPEAQLILAEGRAAVQRRHAASQRRRRHEEHNSDNVTTFRPQDHWDFLKQNAEEKRDASNVGLTYTKALHSRTPSDATDKSTSTITPTASSAMPPSATSPASPLWDYSANLAKFIQTQLNSISSYNPMSYIRSCPDPLSRSKSTPGPTMPQSPTRSERQRSLETPGVIEIPPVRPPLKSAFSAWSSTDEGTEDEASPRQSAALHRKTPNTINYTPSILRYYENGSGSSFLLTSTPLEEEEQPPLDSNTKPADAVSDSHSTTSYDVDYPSSMLSTHPRLTASSAPSLSSVSTASYFECKRQKPHAIHVADGLLAPSPCHSQGKVITAISPFEGGPLATVHDIFVESHNRVHVDGLSFDLVQGSNALSMTARQ